VDLRTTPRDSIEVRATGQKWKWNECDGCKPSNAAMGPEARTSYPSASGFDSALQQSTPRPVVAAVGCGTLGVLVRLLSSGQLLVGRRRNHERAPLVRSGEHRRRSARCASAAAGDTPPPSRQSTESGSRSMATVPSRNGRRSMRRTKPSSSKCTRSWAIGGRSTYLQSASRPAASLAPTVVAACNEKPISDTEPGTDLDASYAAEREQRPRPAFGAGRSEATDRRARQRSQRRLTRSEVLVDHAEPRPRSRRGEQAS
jgi:hypothetical protein